MIGACDLSEENLGRFKENFDLHLGETDLAKALAEAKPDVVSICTYAGSHLPIFEQCVKAGVRAIWCEKLFVLSMADGGRPGDPFASGMVLGDAGLCRKKHAYR